MRGVWRWAAAGGLVAGCAAAALLLAGRGEGEPKKAEPALEFGAHEVVRPVLAGLPQTLRFSGALVAPSTAVVRARAAGTLSLAPEIAEGARVRAGQAIGRIEPPELASRTAERHAQVEAARVALAQAERRHAQDRELATQQFISGAALDGSRSALDAARAQWRAAQASLDTVRATGRDTQLAAPIDGIVARRQALPGEQVAIDQPVATIVDLSRLELAGHVGTHEVARLAPGIGVEVRVEGHDTVVDGRLLRIAPAAEAGTRSIGVAVGIANPGERLRAGQYAVASVVFDDPTPRLVLPSAAVSGSAGQEQVWVIDAGTLKRRSVATGRRDERGGRVEIVSGLDAGAQVIGARFDHLREGRAALVSSQSSAPLAASTAGAPAPALR